MATHADYDKSPITSSTVSIKQDRLGILYLVSGPSGSGKTTLCRRAANEGLAQYAVSATTRPRREGETDGESYHFLTVEQFQEKIANDEFIEHAEVHRNYYGTLKSEIVSHLQAGTDIVMDIDVQGADLIRNNPDPLLQQCLVDLFVMPPSEAELESRLRNRDTDTDEVIALRLKNSIEEMSRWNEYTYRLISADMETDFTAFKNTLLAERRRVSRLLS